MPSIDNMVASFRGMLAPDPTTDRVAIAFTVEGGEVVQLHITRRDAHNLVRQITQLVPPEHRDDLPPPTN